MQFPAFGLFAKDPSPRGVVDTLLSLFDAPVPEAKRAGLLAAAEKACAGRITQANANATGAAVSRLIFGSPEFQFA